MQRRPFIKTAAGIVGLTTLGSTPVLGNPNNGGRLRNAVEDDGTITTTDDNFLIQGQEANEIVATHSGRIIDNTVEDIPRDGIVVDGDVQVTTRNNTIVATDEYPVTNGIQYGRGASGTIQGNEVVSAGIVDETWSGTGILVFEASGVTVVRNFLDVGDIGIAVAAFDGESVNNEVVNNTVETQDRGVSLQAVPLDEEHVAEVLDTNIVSNHLIGDDGRIGIELFASDFFDTGGEATIDGTRLRANRISGFDAEVEEVGDVEDVDERATNPGNPN